MKRCAAVAMLFCVVLSSPLFSQQSTVSKKTTVPPIYGPDAQKARTQAAQANRSADTNAPQQEQQQPKADIITGNMGEVAQFARELQITRDQADSLGAIEADFQRRGRAMAENGMVFRQDISRELKKDSPDFKSVQDKYKLLNDIQYQIRLAMLEAYEQTLQVLTPEQKAKYIQLINEKKESAPAKTNAPDKKSPPPAPRKIPQQKPQPVPNTPENIPPLTDDGDY